MTIKTILVTGATGLLGNNLVREAIAQGFNVKAMVRNIAKAQQQFKDLPQVEFVEFDMFNIKNLDYDFAGIDALFHTAAFFRDSYKGGTHWQELYETNVMGTKILLQKAYDKGVRNYVHISSIAVLDRFKDRATTENDLADVNKVDDYYRSKILSDREVYEFANKHHDLNYRFVLPGWMHGPGDMGPTSAGLMVMDFLKKNLPAIPPGEFSLVDARDVAKIALLALEKGRQGESYLAAGRTMKMEELLAMLEKISGIKAPTFKAPIPMLFLMAYISEIGARLFKKPALISIASLKLLIREQGVMNFDHTKTHSELGFDFRPVAETLRDEIAWIRANLL